MYFNQARVWVPLLLVSSALAFGQTKEFEVASIKPHKGDDGRMSIQITPGGRWRANNIPLNLVLNIAFDLRPGQLTGAPAWINTERYDIDAKLDEANPNPKQGEMQPYLQSLLAKRFGLVFHNETKEQQVYVLTVSKGGPKMKESEPEAKGPMIRMGRGQLTFTKGNMDLLARELSRQIGRVILNETGLKGDYNFDLTYTPEGPGPGGPGGGPDGAGPGPGPGGPGPGGPGGGGGGGAPGGDGPTVFTAVQEQLGLKLDSRKAPVQLFIIDKLEKPEEN